MKKLHHLLALLAILLIATGCPGGNEEPEPPVPPELNDQLEVDGERVELVEGYEVWYGTAYTPYALACIEIYSEGNDYIDIYLPGGTDKHVVQGTYTIAPEPTGGATLAAGRCFAGYRFGREQSPLISGSMAVLVAGGVFAITLEGVDENGKTVRVGYDGALEYEVDDLPLFGGTSSFTLRGRPLPHGWAYEWNREDFGQLSYSEVEVDLFPQSSSDDGAMLGLYLFYEGDVLPSGTYTFNDSDTPRAGTFTADIYDYLTDAEYDLTAGTLTFTGDATADMGEVLIELSGTQIAYGQIASFDGRYEGLMLFYDPAMIYSAAVEATSSLENPARHEKISTSDRPAGARRHGRGTATRLSHGRRVR